jgi:hypothetical protein
MTVSDIGRSRQRLRGLYSRFDTHEINEKVTHRGIGRHRTLQKVFSAGYVGPNLIVGHDLSDFPLQIPKRDRVVLLIVRTDALARQHDG